LQIGKNPPPPGEGDEVLGECESEGPARGRALQERERSYKKKGGSLSPARPLEKKAFFSINTTEEFQGPEKTLSMRWARKKKSTEALLPSGKSSLIEGENLRGCQRQISRHLEAGNYRLSRLERGAGMEEAGCCKGEKEKSQTTPTGRGDI